MAASEIVTDSFLCSVLETADRTKQQCTALLDLLDAHAHAQGATLSSDIESEISAQQRQLYSDLSNVRRLNRAAIQGVRQTKQATTEARQEIDTLHLQLQNLYYEQRHLRGEIQACESYDHKYEQLPLIPVEEFLDTHPDFAEKDDPNALMVTRIEQEHAERKALEERRQGLLKRKQALIAENKKKKEDLAALDKDMEKFMEAIAPIEKRFEKEY